MTLSADQSIRKAKRFAKSGDIARAAALYGAVLAKYPSNKRASEGLESLNETMRRIGAADRAPPQAVFNKLIELVGTGKLHDAVERGQELLKIYPASFELHNLMGVALSRLGRAGDAVRHHEKALSIKPDFVEALWNLGKAHQALRNEEKCIAAHEKARALRLGSSDAYKNLAAAYRSFGRLKAAIAQYKKALKLDPNSVGLLIELGNALGAAAEHESAIEQYEKAIAIDPNSVAAHNNLGYALIEAGRKDDAVNALLQAVFLKPDFAQAHNNLGNAYKHLGRYKDAVASYETALKLQPAYADAAINLGAAFTDLGLRDDAIESYQNALEITPRSARAHYNLSTVKKFKPADPQINQMNDLLAHNILNDAERMHLNFALGKANQDLGEHSAAFAYFADGNRLRKQMINYDIETDRALFARIKPLFDSRSPVPDRQDEARQSDLSPIFIVGMPRSGTSLVEQILASHSEVHGAGELDLLERAIRKKDGALRDPSPRRLELLAENYLSGLDTLSANGRFVTDKMPLNFRWIGWIRRAFPKAKIIHVQRDARAVCWSIFMRSFAMGGNAYAYDMNDISAFYCLYRDLMAFWEEQSPGAIYHLRYEKLVAAQEEETRKLLDHAGLDWETACLDFHETSRSVATASSMQVRQTLYRGSSDAWRDYETFIAPMIERLAAY